MRRIATDEMQQAAAAAATHGPPNDIRQRAELVEADVLEHADRDERVVLAFHASIVVVDELHSIGQAFAIGAGTRVRQLFT